MSNEPMSDDELAAIHADNTYEFYHSHIAVGDIAKLLAEVKRQRAVIAEQQAQIAAMRPVVEAVAKLDARESRENPVYTNDVVLHSDDINTLWVRDQARAYVAQYPATATGEGE